VHSLADCPHVIDIRNMGLIGGDRAGAHRRRADEARLLRPSSQAYQRHRVLIRTTGDIIALSPPLIISKAEIDEACSMSSMATRRPSTRSSIIPTSRQ
jgi:beta-alanine--pyruvate transaminase